MQIPAFPENELLRLACLRGLNVLDTPPELRFDRLTRIAQQCFGVQMALVSLIDADRQWFKSKQGLDAAETPREISFCGHAILQDGIFEVSNALEDERFADNPLVTNSPAIRFYAGAPLVMQDGFHVGTLCIIDPAPRVLTDVDRQILRDLADCIQVELEQQRLLEVMGQYEESQQALLQAKEDAESASRAKSEFVSNMSHEIRTPLNAILGMVQVLAKSELTDKQQQHMGTIHKAGRLLLGIINDVLDFSKIEAGCMTLELREFSLVELLGDLQAIIAPSIGDKPVQLRVEIAPQVPLMVMVDALRLQQVLINLTGNAVKFTDSGEIVIAVDRLVVGDEKKQAIQFSVRDTGIGISTEQQQHLFDAFTQADNSTTRRYGGTGLGLTISNRIVELMGGSIQVTSEPGVGSFFTFTIQAPLLSAQCAHESQVDALPAGPAFDPAKPLSGMHLLLVEDNAFNQAVAQSLLEAAGATLDIASNGEEALQALRDHAERYRLILMDVQMPVMDGLMATKAIRGELGLCNMPVIAMTAGVTAVERKRCGDAGMTAFVGKPLDMEYATAVILRHAFAVEPELDAQDSTLVLGFAPCAASGNMAS
jgi:signal transduction histidine kinase/CheY-like chemotaxis protein